MKTKWKITTTDGIEWRRRAFRWQSLCMTLNGIKSNDWNGNNHLMTLFANIDPGGAVGGRFIRIFDANGTSDARRIFDKSMAFGSLDSRISSSSWNETAIEHKRLLIVHGEYPRRTHQICQFCVGMGPHDPCTKHPLWWNALPSRNHCRQDSATRRVSQYRCHLLPIVLWSAWELSKLWSLVGMLTGARLFYRPQTSACTAAAAVAIAAVDAQTEMDPIAPTRLSFSYETPFSLLVLAMGHRWAG